METKTFEHVKDKLMVAVLNQQSDNRKEIKEGDEVYGIWYDDQRWFKFIVERFREYQDEYKTGLGITDDKSNKDIGNAFRVVKLRNIKPGDTMRYIGEDNFTIKNGTEMIVSFVGYTDKIHIYPSGIYMNMESKGENGCFYGMTDADNWILVNNS
jgi:hypothetical protein